MMRSVSGISDYYLCVSAVCKLISSLKYTKWPGIGLLGHLTPLCTLSLPAPALTRQRPLHSALLSLLRSVSESVRHKQNKHGDKEITHKHKIQTRSELSSTSSILLNHASQRLIVQQYSGSEYQAIKPIFSQYLCPTRSPSYAKYRHKRKSQPRHVTIVPGQAGPGMCC